MNILDLRTVLISYVVSNAVCAIGMAYLWWVRHRRAEELGFWLADFVMQFLAVLLVLVRGKVPDFLSIDISNLLAVGGTLLLYIGLERYVGKPGSQRLNYIYLALFFLVHMYFTYAQPSLQARNINLSVGLFVFCSQCAWLMLVRADAEMRSVSRMVGVIFSIYSLISVARIIIDLAVPPENDLFKSDLYDTLVILTYQMLFIALTFSLLLMRNRRLVDVLESDIVRRKQVELDLRTMSIHDALTGLYNRHFFEEEIARLERELRFPVSILMADVDRLKEINDSQGHAAGDALLRQVAQILTSSFRALDSIARIGGDEFAVLLAETDRAAAEAALQRFRQVLENYNVTHLERPIHLSYGMSTAQKGDLLTDVLKQADENMYREKRRLEVSRADHE
jgi:diguanylate cyclase (GGDEF)-like protein